MAYALPQVWYCDSAQWTAVAAWTTGHAYVAGALVRQSATPTVGNERVFACIVAGTSHATTEPTWVVTKGAKTTDNTVTWQEVTGQPGVNGDTTNSPIWTASSTPALGFVINEPTSGALQICTTSAAGTSSKPTFSATAGVTTSDGSAVWTSLGAASNFVKWKAPHSRCANAIASTWAAAGNTVFVGDDHAETQAATLTISGGSATGLPIYLYCVDHTVSLPPSSSDLKTAATVTTTGNNGINIATGGNANLYFNGFTFNCGTGAVAAVINLGNGNGADEIRLDNCLLALVETGNGSIVFASAFAGKRIFLNTQMSFAAVGQFVSLHGNDIAWKNTASAIVGAAVPTTLFNNVSQGIGAVILCEGVDFSALGSGKTLFGLGGGAQGVRAMLVDCKLGASVTVSNTSQYPGQTVDVCRSDSAATDYQVQRYWFEGTLTPSTTIIRTGGASDGATGISFSIATTANARWIEPFECPPISIWNSTLATNRVVTLYGIWNSASLPNNDQIWVDVEYLGSAATPLASLRSGTKANGLATGSALTADSTSVWSSAATARVNTTAYSVGNVIYVAGASAGGGIFFCTGAGTSAGSPPAGYASAVDGGVVTDSGATFRAGMRFTLSVTLSSPQPALAGYLRATVKAALASSTFFVDPLVNLS